MAVEELDLPAQPGGALLQPAVPQPLRHGGVRGHLPQDDGDIPSEIALGNPHAGDHLRVAFGIAGTGVPAGAAGSADTSPQGRPPTVAGGAGFQRELLQQHRGPVPDSADAVRGAGFGPGPERRAAPGDRCRHAVRRALLAGDGRALRPPRRLAPAPDSLERSAAPPARRRLPGAASRVLWGGPADRAEDRAGFHRIHLRAHSGGLHVAPHPRGIPVGEQSDRGHDSMDRGRAGIRAHLAAALPLSAPDAARSSRSADEWRYQ